MVALVEPRRPFIDGKYVRGDGPTLAVENPATEATIAEVETASTAQIEQAIGAARRSFDDGVWSDTPARERAAVVRRMAEYLADRRDLLVDTVIAEAGAPYENATTIQVGAALDHARTIPDLYLELAQQEYNPMPPTGHTPAGHVAVSMNVYEPVGVVSAISAYNFPFYLNVWKTLPALMAGCSVVLRPSPLTPLVGDAVRRGRRRGRAAARCAQRRDRPGDRRRQAHHDASRGRHGHVHRIDAGRARDHGAGRVDGEEGAPRAGREVGRDLPARSGGERVAHVSRRVHGPPGSGLRAHDSHPRAARPQGRDHGARGRVRVPAPDRRSERPQRHHGPAHHRGAGREVGALRRGRGRSTAPRS